MMIPEQLDVEAVVAFQREGQGGVGVDASTTWFDLQKNASCNVFAPAFIII